MYIDLGFHGHFDNNNEIFVFLGHRLYDVNFPATGIENA